MSRTATSGPVSLTLTVSPDDLDITQRATVTIEVVSDPNVDVTVGDYARAVRGGEHRFEIGVMEGAATPTVPRDDGKRVSTRRYSLTFYLPGEYELPPAAVSFQTQVDTAADDQTSNPADSTGVERLATEPITVTARDESGRQLSPEQLREITTLDPIDLPIPWTKQWWIWVGLTALSALACVILIAPLRRWLLRWLRGDGQSRAVVIPAHEWARNQLAALVAENLLTKGLFQEFHYRISFIVRGYIERRYTVSAGEMTTEEFLVAAVADARFGQATTDELKRFMTACDLVKYARHTPTSAESDDAYRAATEFVERTCAREDHPTGHETMSSDERELTA